MVQTIIGIETKLMKEYYKYFSKYAKGKEPEKKVAWVTAFTPIEILEALGMSYYYPESYAAVIAASGYEQHFLEKSEETYLAKDCCSYSCCIEGCLELSEGPRGIPPKPDVLIATNNQCNTLPNWWNILAERYNVPLIILDYPGENTDYNIAYEYVTQQHKNLIRDLERLTGSELDIQVLENLISNSKKSVEAWNSVIIHLKDRNILPTNLFDDINFLITARCKYETAELYQMMEEEYSSLPLNDESLLPIYWLGYPLWYHPDRYLSSYLDGCKITGANYITWWSLDYSGETVYKKLFNAYNFTFLNLSQKTRNCRLKESINKAKAKGVIVLHNKSCKCDFVSAKNIELPQVEIEMDMIDRTIINEEEVRRKIALLKETICME